MSSQYYKQILEKNKTWAEEKLRLYPEFFTDLAEGQEPPLLWIGCSDSRVPANTIIGAKAGEVFVHRNIANVVVHTDMNILAVVDYAVNVLKVKDIIVCGHYGCGGVKTAMGNESVGLIDNWLRHIKDVYRFNKKVLDQITDKKEKFERFVEINTREQVYNLAKTTIIQNAWASGQILHIHGLVYDLKTGIINDMDVSLESNTDLDRVFQLDI